MYVGCCTVSLITFGQGGQGLLEGEASGLFIEGPRTDPTSAFVRGVTHGESGMVSVVAGFVVSMILVRALHARRVQRNQLIFLQVQGKLEDGVWGGVRNIGEPVGRVGRHEVGLGSGFNFL